MPSTFTSLDPAAVRAQFPTLSDDFAFLENAGGSQVPEVVVEAIRGYLLDCCVQIGASYPHSVKATQTVAEAHRFVETFMNAGEAGKAVLGPSTTQLLMMLAHAYGEILVPGDEVVIAESNHESNAGPWERLRRFGVVPVIWPVDRESQSLRPETLIPLLNERTKLVCFPHVSNLLGEVIDVAEVTRAAHAVGAKVVVDGVAYAPHAPIDVQAWEVDWYVYSTYKVFGPHMAALYGTHDAFEGLTGPNHFFIDRDNVPLKWEPGSLAHESCAGIAALGRYFEFLSGGHSGRRGVVEAFEAMERLERPVHRRLVEYLRTKPVRLVGPGHADEGTIGTVSFVHERIPSPEIVAHTDRRGIGIRHGHMYAYRLCEALGIDPATGVVRVSLVHYNTLEEIDRLIEALEDLL
jgi:cysteine desulfurase family protein (TIGR01976 family)